MSDDDYYYLIRMHEGKYLLTREVASDEGAMPIEVARRSGCLFDTWVAACAYAELEHPEYSLSKMPLSKKQAQHLNQSPIDEVAALRSRAERAEAALAQVRTAIGESIVSDMLANLRDASEAAAPNYVFVPRDVLTRAVEALEGLCGNADGSPSSS